jgi:hypothetical protein
MHCALTVSFYPTNSPKSKYNNGKEYIVKRTIGIYLVAVGVLLISIIVLLIVTDKGRPKREIDPYELTRNKFRDQTNQFKERSETTTRATTRFPDGATIQLNHRFWKDYASHLFSGTLAIFEKDYSQQATNREYLALDYDKDGYPALYTELVNTSLGELDEIYLQFDSLKSARSYSRTAFAELIVTCIQDIPYVLTHELSCNSIDSYSDYAKEYHAAGKPCKPDCKYGLLSPTEFLYELNGDCDTRTVAIFTILKHYGYDVVILNSEEYGHSILGINLPAHGDYKIDRGKKYYVWELTAEDWQIGMLSPSINNMNYWNVMIRS